MTSHDNLFVQILASKSLRLGLDSGDTVKVTIRKWVWLRLGQLSSSKMAAQVTSWVSSENLRGRGRTQLQHHKKCKYLKQVTAKLRKP